MQGTAVREEEQQSQHRTKYQHWHQQPKKSFSVQHLPARPQGLHSENNRTTMCSLTGRKGIPRTVAQHFYSALERLHSTATQLSSPALEPRAQYGAVKSLVPKLTMPPRRCLRGAGTYCSIVKTKGFANMISKEGNLSATAVGCSSTKIPCCLLTKPSAEEQMLCKKAFGLETWRLMACCTPPWT